MCQSIIDLLRHSSKPAFSTKTGSKLQSTQPFSFLIPLLSVASYGQLHSRNGILETFSACVKSFSCIKIINLRKGLSLTLILYLPSTNAATVVVEKAVLESGRPRADPGSTAHSLTEPEPHPAVLIQAPSQIRKRK